MQNLPNQPGVYTMLDAKAVVIYVGKAKNLKKRLASYFASNVDVKTAALVQNIADISFTVTFNEVEALILECELIYRWQPRYNIIFKSGSKYPYILLSKDQFPQLKYYRGAISDNGDYFGPFPNVKAVHENIDLLHKTFKIRNCENSVFKQRTRPCLQYQIKRCSAPCVNLISPQEYQQDIERAKLFLSGNIQEVMGELASKMDELAQQEKFEEAAKLRDQIISLRTLVKKQTIVNTTSAHNIDVIALAEYMHHYLIHIIVVRGGRIIGSDQHVPINQTNLAISLHDMLTQFIVQHYLNSPRPDKIVVNKVWPECEQISTILGIPIVNASGQNKKLVEMAQKSAALTLTAKVSKEAVLLQQFAKLSGLLGKNLQTIECIDISHHQGDATMAAIVAFNINGPVKSHYRRFNIKNAKGGDDYAAIEESLTRHLLKKQSQGMLADLLIIDGGKGQLHVAEQVLTNLKITEVTLISMAKGPQRKTGLEVIYLNSQGKQLDIDATSLEFMLLARVRDEAHRFAITGHRNKMASKQVSSKLELVRGIGKEKRRLLLQQFGGLVEIENATIEELAAVPGINLVLARRIYYALHHPGENQE